MNKAILRRCKCLKIVKSSWNPFGFVSKASASFSTSARERFHEAPLIRVVVKGGETLDPRVTLPPPCWTSFSLRLMNIHRQFIRTWKKKSGFFQIETLRALCVPTRAFFHSGCDGQSVSRICCRFLVPRRKFRETDSVPVPETQERCEFMSWLEQV